MDIISEFENGDAIVRIDGFDMPLHSAAPDLLAALVDIAAASAANCGDSLANAIQAAQTAIAKAKGN